MTTNRDLARYTLRHADDCLVLSHRLAEWSSFAPDLEEDIALTNIGLDLLGQARLLYTYAAEVEGDKSEDDYAYFRDERQYTNLLLVEQPNGDFGASIARQVLFSTYQQLVWDRLGHSKDATLSAIATKASKETAYHLRHSRTWLRRLGDGTEESNERTQAGMNALWRYTGELFMADELDETMTAAGVGVDPGELSQSWQGSISEDLREAGLAEPSDQFQTSGGRQGRHTNHLGLLLAEMQVLQRTYPGASW